MHIQTIRTYKMLKRPVSYSSNSSILNDKRKNRSLKQDIMNKQMKGLVGTVWLRRITTRDVSGKERELEYASKSLSTW